MKQEVATLATLSRTGEGFFFHMSALDRADAYLTIPPAYGDSLGGLRWSHGCDAIERADGTTLALALELGHLLEGVFSRPPVPPFAFVLNLFHAMRQGPETASV